MLTKCYPLMAAIAAVVLQQAPVYGHAVPEDAKGSHFLTDKRSSIRRAAAHQNTTNLLSSTIGNNNSGTGTEESMQLASVEQHLDGTVTTNGMTTFVDGASLSELKFGAPTNAISLEADTVAEWTLLIPALTETVCALTTTKNHSDGQGGSGDTDLALYSQRDDVLSASIGPYSEERFSHWGDTQDRNMTVALAAFDDVRGLVLACDNKPINKLELGQTPTKTVLLRNPGFGVDPKSARFLLNVSHVSDDVMVNCSYNFHYFGGRVDGAGGIAWHAVDASGTNYSSISGWVRDGFPMFLIPSNATMVLLLLANPGNSIPANPHRKLRLHCDEVPMDRNGTTAELWP